MASRTLRCVSRGRDCLCTRLLHTVPFRLRRFSAVFSRNEGLPAATLLTYRLAYKYEVSRSQTYSSSAKANDKPSTFGAVLSHRKSEARRSVLVQVQTRQAAGDLYLFCKQHANVKKMYYYSLPTDKQFILVEVDTEEGLQAILKEAKFPDSEVIPAYSPFLLFSTNKKSSKDSPLEDFCHADNATIQKKLLTASDISQQMIMLFTETRLHDLETRLRYLICTQLEKMASGIFPESQVYPFGSTVNGCGKYQCDLDMVLSLEPEPSRLQNPLDNRPSVLFQTKLALTNSRIQVQRNLEALGDMANVFMPGCIDLQRILQAQVPIVKFRHCFTGVECDLSMSNLTGVYMSELLYLFCESDERVQPLLFTVLKWARENSVTQNTPGRWVTNFQLTLMVLFFLQQHPIPILPSIQTLIKAAGPSDVRITEGVNCTFLRNVDNFPKSDNEESLGELLKEFFLFYEGFEFKDRGMSLCSGSDIMKSDYAALHIENPLELTLNVSKNVGAAELETLSQAIRNALWCLETEEASKDNSWGIIRLFEPHLAHKTGFRVRDLFSQQQSAGNTSLGLPQKSTKTRDKQKKQAATYEYVAKNSTNTVVLNDGVNADAVLRNTRDKLVSQKELQKLVQKNRSGKGGGRERNLWNRKKNLWKSNW